MCVYNILVKSRLTQQSVFLCCLFPFIYHECVSK